MTPKYLIIEDQILQFASLNRHQHTLVSLVDLCDHTTGAVGHCQCGKSAVAHADPAAETEFLMDDGALTTRTISVLGLQ